MPTLFSLSAPLLLLVAAAFGTVSLLIAYSVMLGLRRTGHAASEQLPVAAFMGTVTTAWALALGFVAADVWSVRAHAEQAASAERSSIMRLAGAAGPAGIARPEMVTAVEQYDIAVRNIEWTLGANIDPVSEVEAALQAIRIAIVEAARTPMPTVLIGKVVQDFDELQDARNERLAIGNSSVSLYKWYLVLFLTFLSMVVIAVVHADRPVGARNALLIFATAAVVSLWILGLHASPYSGPARLSADEIRPGVTLRSIPAIGTGVATP